MTTVSEFNELLNAASARGDLPLRVKLANGELRDIGDLEREEELEELDSVEEASGERQSIHRVLGYLLHLAPRE